MLSTFTKNGISELSGSIRVNLSIEVERKLLPFLVIIADHATGIEHRHMLRRFAGTTRSRSMKIEIFQVNVVLPLFPIVGDYHRSSYFFEASMILNHSRYGFFRLLIHKMERRQGVEPRSERS